MGASRRALGKTLQIEKLNRVDEACDEVQLLALVRRRRFSVLGGPLFSARRELATGTSSDSWWLASLSLSQA
jgi:hypothetical protein